MDMEEKCRVLYKCKYEECGKLYVGEIEISLHVSERAQEHDKSVKEGESKSALSQHQVKTGHEVLSKPVIKSMSDR